MNLTKQIFGIAIIIFCQINAFGQGISFNNGGAWHSSIGGMQSNAKSFYSLYGNPAGLLEANGKWGFDVSYEKRFNIEELATVSLGGFYKLKNDVFGISASQFGYEDYKEQKINLIYTRKLVKNFNLGMAFSYLQYRLDEFGSRNNFSFDIGLKATVSKQLDINAFINNPLSIKFNDQIDLPVRLAIGTDYHPSKKVHLLAEVEKILDAKITVKTGIIYYPTNSLDIRVGGDLTRNFIGIGVGYNLNGFNVHGAYSLNQVLGNSPAISLSYMK